MQDLLQIIHDHFLFAAIAACFIIGMLLNAITRIINNTSRERSRREIAAYIAEGSITPEQGERLIKADINRNSRET